MIAPLFESAHRLEALFVAKGLRCCIIGGVALQRWGAPRSTIGVDLTLLAEFGHEREAATLLLETFSPRIDGAVEFAAMHRVVLVRDTLGTSLDIALGAMPFEVRTVERSSLFGVGEGKSIRTCSAEDLVVHKGFAGRPQDWIDIASVLTRTRDLDWIQIEAELVPLLELKGTEDAWGRITELRDKAAAR